MKTTKSRLVSYIILLSLIAAAPIIAGGYNGRVGKSNVAHLYLYEKDPSTWEIVEDGSWGKMTYNTSGSELKYVFNGHQLVAGQDYVLIYYPDPWPGEGLICLGTGRVDENGNLHLRGPIDTGDLPAENDDNYPDGGKIWLVLLDDVDCDEAQMIGWNPAEYLFEYDLVTFDDTDE